MPTFSDDPVVDLCVAEAVLRRGEEDEREAREAAEMEGERKKITGAEHQKQWAEENGLTGGGGAR